MYSGSIYFLVLKRKETMLKHKRRKLLSIEGVYGLLATRPQRQLNELTFARAITGKDNLDQLIGFSMEELEEIALVIKNERTFCDRRVAVLLERAKSCALAPNIGHMCAEWQSTQAEKAKQDRERDQLIAAEAKAMEAEKAEKAEKEKQDRERNRLIAAEANAIKEKQKEEYQRREKEYQMQVAREIAIIQATTAASRAQDKENARRVAQLQIAQEEEYARRVAQLQIAQEEETARNCKTWLSQIHTNMRRDLSYRDALLLNIT